MTKILVGDTEIVLDETDKRQIAHLLEELFVSEFWNERALPIKFEQVLLAIKEICGR